MTPPAHIVSELKKGSLFAQLSRDVVDTMARELTFEQWPESMEVMSPERSARRFFVILRGRVKTSCADEVSGRELTLSVLGPGDVFNIVTLLDGRCQMLAARTIDDVQAVSGPVALWRAWLGRYPALRSAIELHLARRLRETTELAMNLSLHDTMTRLARLLLRNCDASGKSSARRNCLIDDFSHEELAYLIGSIRVFVSRLMGQLKREGAITVRDGTIYVRDVNKLMMHAQMHPERAARR